MTAAGTTAGPPSRPFVQACENNKHAIAAALISVFEQARSVLELASGSGQHAVHLAAAMPWLTWYPTDLAERLDGIEAWRRELGGANLAPARVLDVAAGPWPARRFDAVFSANSIHFMAWTAAVAMFEGIAACLEPGGVAAFYGPFNRDGAFTSPGNRALDAWLRALDPEFGLRGLEDVVALADANGLVFAGDVAMPANNHLLFFQAQRA